MTVIILADGAASPLNGAVLRPRAIASPSPPEYTPAGYTRLWASTTKSEGNVEGVVTTDTGFYSVKWWDDTVNQYDSGSSFSRAAEGGHRAFEIYPVSYTAQDFGPDGRDLFRYFYPTTNSEGGVRGGYANFGNYNGLRYPDAAPFSSNGTQSLTINIWAKTTVTGSYPYLISTTPEAWPYYGWSLRQYDDDTIKAQLGGSGGQLGAEDIADVLSSTSTINDGEWHMVTLVIDADENVVSLWIDGVQEDSDSIAGIPIDYQSGAELTVGYRQGQGDWFWQDQLDEVAIWGRALSQSEIEAVYNDGEGVTWIASTSNVLGYWPLDEFLLEQGGQFDGFDVSGNELTQLRAESVSLGYEYSWPYGNEDGDLSNNLLTSAALDQFYTDLYYGHGDLFVQGNPGIDADDPTIATAKGYTVFGSTPPSTTLLLHFDGDDEDTFTTDSSPEEYTITFNDGAEISTAQSKWGGSSVDLTGGGYLSVTDSGTLLPASEDFTIEAWVYLTSGPTNTVQAILGANGSIVWASSFYDGGILFAEHGGVGGMGFQGGDGVPLNEWAHVALSRQGNTFRMFLNGVLQATNTSSASFSPWGDYEIGSWYGDARDFLGYIDDLRVVSGTALYTENFSPPTGPLTVYP